MGSFHACHPRWASGHLSHSPGLSHQGNEEDIAAPPPALSSLSSHALAQPTDPHGPPQFYPSQE